MFPFHFYFEYSLANLQIIPGYKKFFKLLDFRQISNVICLSPFLIRLN